MATPTWDETEDLDIPSFDDTEELVETPDAPSMTESALRGAVQGATFGLGEEVGAATLTPIESARRFISQYIPGTPEAVNKELEERGFTIDQPSVYQELRDTARAANVAAKEENPWAYGIGEVTGGIAPSLATGGAGALAGAAKTGVKELAKAGAKAGAKYGALSGLGYSEADLTEGEIGKATKDIAVGAGLGAATGAALPVVAKGAKEAGKATVKGMKAVEGWLEDVTGFLGRSSMEAARTTAKGVPVTSTKALEVSKEALKKEAEKAAKAVTEIAKPKAQKLIKESLDTDAKINLTDQIDDYIKKLDTQLADFTPNDPQAITMGNMRAKFLNIKDNLLKAAGQDPKIQTRTELYNKLLQKKAALDAESATGIYQAKAIDNLFNKAAKMKGDWVPDRIEVEKIQKDFNLGNTDDAIEMLKNVAKLKIKKPVYDPKSGEMKEVPYELLDVIKRYDTDIVESQGHLMLRKGTSTVGRAEPFRPDQITQPIEMTPQQVLNLRDEIRGYVSGADGLAKKTGTEISEGLTQQLKKGVAPEKAAQFEEGMKIYRDIYGLEDVVPGIGQLPKEGVKAEKVVEKLEDLFTKELTGLQPGDINTVTKGFTDRLMQVAPELGDDFINKVVETSKTKALQEIADKSGQFSALGSIGAMGVRAGAAGGNIYRKIAGIANMPSDRLKQVADIARTKSPKVANLLDNLSGASETRKNALLFSASQNPEMRKTLEEILGLDKETEE